jgi:hypothetical protein
LGHIKERLKRIMTAGCNQVLPGIEYNKKAP